MNIRWPLVVLLLGLVLPMAAVADTPVQVFRGLTTIEIQVIGITPAMEAEGLYERDILDDTDRRLRRTRLLLRRGRAQPLAGIGVIDPVLMVTPICRPSSSGKRLCNVVVEMRESVSLVRDPAVRFVGASWRNTWSGEINRFNELRRLIEGMVDQFAQDYNAIN